MRKFLGEWRRYMGKPAILACFILCALPVGILTALITPPGESPDESKHLARAAGLLHGAVLGERKLGFNAEADPPGIDLMTGFKADTGLYLATKAPVTAMDGRDVVTSRDFLAARAQPADHRLMFITAPNTATYFPAAYLPAALGLAAGLAVKAPPYACLLLARMAMLAGFMVLGGLALGLAAYGEALLLAVLILPMTLFLAGTVNEDSVLIGFACLACALLTRGGRGSRFWALLLFVLFLGAKPPYILFLGAFLLPWFGPGFRRRARGVALACVPVLAWVAVVLACIEVPFGKQRYQPGPLYTGDRNIWLNHTDAKANLHILLSPPTRLISLPWHTQEFLGVQLLHSMIGILGLLRIPLGFPVYVAWGVCLAAAAAGLLFSPRPAPVSAITGLANLATVLGLALVTYWLLMIMFYLNWSNVGQDYIAGMQGRYALPMLPFLLLGVPALSRRLVAPPLLPALPAVAMGIYDIGYIPMKLVWSFYLH